MLQSPRAAASHLAEFQSKSRGGHGVPYGTGVGELGVFSLENGSLCGDLTATSRVWRGYREVGEGQFIRNWSDRTKGNSFKLTDVRFR